MATKAEIIRLLETNDRAVAKAVWRIHQYQTEAERAVQATTEHNGVGFNAFDAEILSSFAEQINRGRTLSQKQMAIARKKMRKYAGQLARIAAEREKAKQEAEEMAAERESVLSPAILRQAESPTGAARSRWLPYGATGIHCCDQQRRAHGCVCAALYRCPVHGEVHVGTHD